MNVDNRAGEWAGWPILSQDGFHIIPIQPAFRHRSGTPVLSDSNIHSVTDSDIAAGTVGFSGDDVTFDDLKIWVNSGSSSEYEYDASKGDKLLFDEPFASTDTANVYNRTGNLIDDGTFVYQYDACNRLEQALSARSGRCAFRSARLPRSGAMSGSNKPPSRWPTPRTLMQLRKPPPSTASAAGCQKPSPGLAIWTGRSDSTMMVKGSQRAFTCGLAIRRQRSEAAAEHPRHAGSQPPNGGSKPPNGGEVLMVRIAGKGDYYVYQDQNYNVTALVDQGGADIEKYDYTPYGELTVSQVSGPGDYDGDGDVDATDRAAAESMGACRGANPEGACRILDLDFDADDLTLFDLLDQGDRREPDLPYSRIGFRFGHQGLLYDAEIESYQNRARQYLPKLRRFAQRDPLAQVNDASSGNANGIAFYGYVMGNPVRLRDSTGLTTEQAESCCQAGPPSDRPGVVFKGWLCCNGPGQIEVCVNESIEDGCVRECIREHESVHADAMEEYCDCYPGEYPYPVDIPAPPGKEHGSECDGFSTEITCLKRCMRDRQASHSKNDPARKQARYACCMKQRVCGGILAELAHFETSYVSAQDDCSCILREDCVNGRPVMMHECGLDR